MKSKTACILFIMILMFAFGGITASADEAERKTVIISHNMPPVVNDSVLYISVLVDFGDEELYNDGVKLSYKLYDRNMELLSNENERFPLTPDGTKASLDICISLPDCSSVIKGEDVIIKFDIVDEKNVYWFGDSPVIELKSSDIRYEYKFWDEFVNQYAYILKNQPVQLILNIAGLAAAVFLFIKIRRNLAE